MVDASRLLFGRPPSSGVGHHHRRIAVLTDLRGRGQVSVAQRSAAVHAGGMTRDQRQALADRLFAEHIYHVDYIRGSIGLLATLPILYGILTWVFGDELWSGSDVYKTALTMPAAPQSWGTLFIGLGVALMLCAAQRRYRLVMAIALATALVLGMFMVTFGMEYVTTGNESALPPALAWGVFSLLFLNLWRLGSKMRKLEVRYDQPGVDHDQGP